jgi:hypothetical protein
MVRADGIGQLSRMIAMTAGTLADVIVGMLRSPSKRRDFKETTSGYFT